MQPCLKTKTLSSYADLGPQGDNDKADKDGQTPLQIAAKKGNLEVLVALLESGADKDKGNPDADQFGPLLF